MTSVRLVPVLLAALLLVPACDRGEKELTPEEAAAKLASDLEEAAARVRNNKLEDAEKIYTRILEQQPDNADAQAGMAKVRFEQKNYDEAETLYAAAIAKKGDDPDMHFMLGHTRQLAGKANEAAEAFGRAFEMNGENSDYGLYYGRELKKIGQLEKAEEVLRQVAEIDPKAQFVFTEIGDVLLEMNKPDDALKTYMKAQTTYPSNKEAFAGAALAYEAKGDNARALDQWSSYIRMDCCSSYSKDVAQKKIETLKVDDGQGGGDGDVVIDDG
ncbi:tetratricopeptide repeat protein [Paraliomyxa miuraensis]|uniref:tetratricopeptide repeat protein n=1 Tax=Paraliomyxa miuraensis TaxID=376150 RepID=UPI00225444E2|nr:tetratricopeptide repeat protein [Paraliomyxa miuraensis]MCX4243204.1 tetratricopeptide repeat protein [Paraliomyxa miuraensis]